MNRLLNIVFALFFTFCSLSAQDIIITNDAKKIDAKILEVSKSEIKYKESDNLEGPTFILEVSDISSIVYSNGKVVLYNSNEEKNKAVQISKSEVTEETVNNEQETSKESEQKISNIATINTKDGQTFKGELVAINNSNVTFLQNGEQKTLSAEQLVNVIFANGQVKIYGNKAIMQSVATASKKETVKEDKPTSTAAVSIKGRIYRDNGHYMYNDTYISSKEVERILQRENNSNENDEDEDDSYNLNAFKKTKNLGLDDIFTDNGLKELCRKLPIDEKELNRENIFGINQKSLKNYGKEFLPIIIQFIEENNIKKEELKEMKREKEENENKKKKEKSEKKKKEKTEKKKKEKNEKKEKKKGKEKKEKKEEKEEEKEEEIEIPENGVFIFNNDELYDLAQIQEEFSESKSNKEIIEKKKEEEIKEENEELEEMEKEEESKKEEIEKIDENIRLAKEIAINNNKKHKRGKIDSDNDDDNDDSKSMKKKSSWDKYNYFQRKAIFGKMRKGKGKRK